MKNFRFRLDPVMRLKEYHISQVEEEIARIQAEIQRFLMEIEEGRTAVHAMRQKILEIDDRHFLMAERELDLFSQFNAREEQRKFGEIARLNQEKDKRQQELVKLYQEKKVLERLKERRRTEWEGEMRKEESAIMDEIGTQKFIRRDRELGGVILYLLIPIALIAAAAAIGIATGVINQEMVDQIKTTYFNKSPKSATETIQSATDTIQEEFITLEKLIGDPNTPMPVLLQNFADRLEQVQKKEQQLAEWEKQLQEKQAIIEKQEEMLAGLTKQASDYLIAYQDTKRQLEQNQKSELSKYEEDVAKTLSSAKGKDIATIMSNLYNPPAEKIIEQRLTLEEQTLRAEESQLLLQEQQLLADQTSSGAVDPALLNDIRQKKQINQTRLSENQKQLKTVQDKIRESQLLLLRILHRFQDRGRKDLFVALNKTSSNIAAQIIADFATTSSMELNQIKPTPTPSSEQIESGTASSGA